MCKDTEVLVNVCVGWVSECAVVMVASLPGDVLSCENPLPVLAQPFQVVLVVSSACMIDVLQ